jgi:hypothetical protein
VAVVYLAALVPLALKLGVAAIVTDPVAVLPPALAWSVAMPLPAGAVYIPVMLSVPPLLVSDQVVDGVRTCRRVGHRWPGVPFFALR